MNVSRPQVTLVSAFIVLITTPVLFGVGPYCDPTRRSVVNADTIVVGRTINVDSEEVRPGLNSVTYEFRVDGVLKGSRYKPGDSIIQRYEPRSMMMRDAAPFPRIDEDPHIVFVHLNENGEERFGCAEPAEGAVVKRIRRQLEVLENPPRFLSSKDEEDILTVLKWIGRNYVSYGDRREPSADWSRRAEPDRGTIVQYLTRHAEDKRDEVSIQALSVLSSVHPAEAFDTFVKALGSEDEAKISIAAQGLKRLADKRAVPVLIKRLGCLRDEDEERRRRIARGEDVAPKLRRQRGWGHMSPWMPKNELMTAISSFDDPAATRFLLDALDEGANRQAVWSMAGRIDPRAVEPLLRLTWEGDSSAASALDEYDDERIVEQARERMFDHPFAPRLLAAHGDPQAREFMIRLIRQGHYAGARWAAETRNPSAKAGLVRSLMYYGGDYYNINMVAYALGRMRAFDLIPGLLDESTNMDTLVKASEMVMGLADLPRGRHDDCGGADILNCIRKSVRDMAASERWTSKELRLANDLIDTVEHRPKSPNRHDLYHPWSPPEALSDMPDPLDTEATSAYLTRNAERCREVLRDGSIEDQYKVMQAARHCKTHVLDGDLAIRLLTGPDGIVRGKVASAVAAGELTLSPEEIERWAISGDSMSTRSALNYIYRHPKPEYAPSVTKILHQGRHLFDETLFRAIIETGATGCADLLRAYLEDEHFTLRLNAAVTLVHLGDEAGKAVLAELEPNRRGCSGCIRGDYLQLALEQIGQ